MSQDLDKLQRMLEQATAEHGPCQDNLDPEAASLREVWLLFGELLDATQPAQHVFPLSLGERAGGRSIRSAQRRQWLLPMTSLLAASLLIAVATMWLSRSTDESLQLVPQQMASTGKTDQSKPVQDVATPQWDDQSLDEQIAQVGQNIKYAGQDRYTTTDPFGSLRYGIDDMQKELATDKL